MAAAATAAAPARVPSSISGGMPAGSDAPRAVAETIRGPRGALRSPGRTTAAGAVVALPGGGAGEEAEEAEAEVEAAGAAEAAAAAGEAGTVDARSPRRGE